MVHVTFPRRLIMNETGQIHPAGDVRHILPGYGFTILQGCKVLVLLKINEKMQNKSTLFNSFIIVLYCDLDLGHVCVNQCTK